MNINLLTRVAIDKNFFIDFVIACYLLKNKGYLINVKFIGDIKDKAIFQTVERTILLLNLKNQVKFTKKSVKINEIKKIEEYYFNLSIGTFVGYSSIECIDVGLKTLFYNVDKDLSNLNGDFIYINSFESLCVKLEQIYLNREKYDEIIKKENLSLVNNYYLNEEDISKLKQILK